jgi:hypothetical protein
METVMVCVHACKKLFFTSVTSLGFLPYLYFSDGSVFRSTWFDIYVTCSIWFFTVQGNLAGKNSESAGSGGFGLVARAFCNILHGFVDMVLLLTLSIIYFPEAKAGFEYEWTLYTIIVCSSALGCGLCGLCTLCLHMLLWASFNEQQKEQLKDELSEKLKDKLKLNKETETETDGELERCYHKL